MASEVMRRRFVVMKHMALVAVAAASLASACDGAGATDAAGMCLAEEPIPVNETPPLPGDACEEPPSPASFGIEARARSGQDQAAMTAAELLDPDAITVVTCGTGSPFPSDRAQSCTAVFAGGQFLLFDAGDGAQASMEDLLLPVVDLSAIFLTHFHSDHMADLGEVISRSWILGRTEVLPVYGGPTVERIVDGFNLVYSPDEVYRLAHHGEEVLPPKTLAAIARRIDDTGIDGMIVYDEGGVVVRAYGVDHSPVAPALGYRVEFGGRSVGISGDTVDTSGLRALADGADVLVGEVMDKGFALDSACAFERLGDERNARLLRDIRTYHMAVDELAQLSADADVGTLVLTHQVPSVPPTQARALFEAPIARVFAGPIVVAEDGTRVTIDIE